MASLEADGAGRGRAVTRLALNGKPAFLIGEDLAVRTCHGAFAGFHRGGAARSAALSISSETAKAAAQHRKACFSLFLNSAFLLSDTQRKAAFFVPQQCRSLLDRK